MFSEIPALDVRFNVRIRKLNMNLLAILSDDSDSGYAGSVQRKKEEFFFHLLPCILHMLPLFS